MNSFRQMMNEGTIKRADASKIRYADIYLEPGLNWRDYEDPDFKEDLDSLVRHMEGGGPVPALEVRPREEGGVWVVDGHRRYMAYGILIERGKPIEWIPIVQFDGNDVKRMARVATSQEGRKLKPMEIAEGYRRLHAYGVSPDDIAELVNKTRQHVDQMLVLANAPYAVQQMVKRGEVSPTLAMQMVRTHGDKAVDKLKAAQAQAKAQGKKKVTAGTAKPWTPPATAVQPVLSTLDKMKESLSGKDRMQLLNKPTDDATVQLPASVVWELMEQLNGIQELREAAEQRRREKEAKAKQGDLLEGEEGNDGE